MATFPFLSLQFFIVSAARQQIPGFPGMVFYKSVICKLVVVWDEECYLFSKIIRRPHRLDFEEGQREGGRN